MRIKDNRNANDSVNNRFIIDNKDVNNDQNNHYIDSLENNGNVNNGTNNDVNDDYDVVHCYADVALKTTTQMTMRDYNVE